MYCYCPVLYFCASYYHIISAMASLWYSFVDAVTPGHNQPGQERNGHHNYMVGDVHCPTSLQRVMSGGHAPGLAPITEGYQVTLM